MENKNKTQNTDFDPSQTEEMEDNIFDIDEEGVAEEWEKEITPSAAEDGNKHEEEGKNKEQDLKTEEDKNVLQELFENNINREEGETPSEQTKEDENTKDGEEELKTIPQYDKLITSNTKLNIAKQLLYNIQTNSEKLVELLEGELSSSEEEQPLPEINYEAAKEEHFQEEEKDGSKVVEGVFNGEDMIGSDGQRYTVPMNYASKSKLVEGDVLKLTITANGSFVYKQIQPIDRQRMVGVLQKTVDGDYVAVSNDKSWNLLSAAVTYFKGRPGDEVIFFIPKEGKSKWAAVENIIRQQNY